MPSPWSNLASDLTLDAPNPAASIPEIHATFGTYRVRGSECDGLVRRALDAGFRRIDTAQLYKNEAVVFRVVRDFEASHPGQHVHVTSKLYSHLLYDQTLRAVANSVERLERPLDTMLLHRPLPIAMWRALDACVERGLVKSIGVSNYWVHRLTELLDACDGVCRLPAVNQVEFHPFVGPVHPLLSLCRQHGIQVQGHTILAQGKYLDFLPLQRLARRVNASPAAVLVHWVKAMGVEPVIHSTSDLHLSELIGAVTASQPLLSERDVVELSGYYDAVVHRFYPEPVNTIVTSEFSEILETSNFVEAVARRLDEDRRALAAGMPVSEMATNLPSNSNRQLLTDPVANQLALKLFPVAEGSSEESSYNRFRELVRKLRVAINEQRSGRPKPKKRLCSLPAHHPALGPVRLVKGEPISDAIQNPLPMPVEVAPAEELRPFFEFLANPGRLELPHDTPAVFTRGAYYSDARMDLCKQVVGPEHIEALCDAVLDNQTREPAHGALTFARGTYFADQRMDLCKQVVGPAHIEALCDAVLDNVQGQAHRAAEWGRVRHFLLGNNIACDGPSRRGAQAMGRLMADPRVDIETWYLAGNCIGPEDMQIMAQSLEPNRSARALWLKRNPLGAEGARHLGWLLGKNDTLSLLDVDNTGWFDEGARAFAEGVLDSGGTMHLRHWYASSNGFTEATFEALRPVFTQRLPEPCSLVSLAISLNRFGNEGCDAFVDLLETGALGDLERVDLGSIGLSGNLERLCVALVRHCPKLRSLDLGTYLSTRDLGEQANQLDEDVGPLALLLQTHPALELLDVALCGLPAASAAHLLANLGAHQSIHGVGAAALRHDDRARRFLKHPRRVVHIDSIYRGR